MARKLIDQDEAARILGVTSEEIGSLRDRKKLFPYRDGDQWKYKPEDIEQLREEMAEGKAAGESGAGSSWISANVAAEQAAPGTPQAGESWAGSALDDVELEVNEELDSILLSEIELGKSGEGPSTIIGKRSESEEDADVLPAGEAKPATPAAETSDLKLADSNVSLDATPGSDVRLVATGSDATRTSPGPGSTGNLFGSDALSLSDDELSLIGSSPSAGAVIEPKKPGSSDKLPGPGSSLKLDEDDFVIGGKGSDVTLSTDSGIQLISAADSGLSLEQPLEVGSSAKELLELGEADVVSLEDQTVTETPTEATADEEFLLTALDEAGADESDSGSQVIALDTDDVSSGMFAPLTAAGGAPMLEEEPAVPLSGAPLLTTAPSAAPTQVAVGAVAAEAPFSTGNIVALVCCAVILLLCGMMTYDLMRNMWSWDGPYSINSSIMDSLGNTIGWFDR